MNHMPWGVVQDEMDAATAGEPTNIEEVVGQLHAVQRALDRLPDLYGENPVSDFNKLYTTITERILDRDRSHAFRDPSFLNRLDVEFAKRYLVALRQWGANDPNTPGVWSVLFRRYNDVDLRSLPCAVAGVNAHINYDLPFALVETWRRVGHSADGSAQHHDYLVVNEVFAEEIPGLRRSFLAGWQRCIDRLNGNFDDWYQNVLVELTRDRAWARAQLIWLLRDDPRAVGQKRAEFDRDAARIGRMLLSPFCALLQ
jgi:hypothetical protein